MSRLCFPSSALMCITAQVVFAAGCNAPGSADSKGPSSPQPPNSAHQKSDDMIVKPETRAATEPVAIASFESFETYWPAFRTAIQGNDAGKLTSLTRFPFETRGGSDDDPVRKMSRTEFLHALDSMLNEDPGLWMNGKETQREHIARSSSLTERQYASGDDTARVGIFEFEKQGGRWWFTRAYVSEE